MLNRPRLRRPALAVASVVAAAGLTACGSELVTVADRPSAEGFDAFTISGEVGKAPQVEFEERMTAGDVETETVEEGDGSEIATDDYVQINLTVFNGYDGERTFTTYGQGGGGAQDVQVTADDPVFGSLAGQRIGSRVALVGSAPSVFGEEGVGGIQFGIGNTDAVLYVIDVMREGEAPVEPEPILDAPAGDQQPAPAWAPRIVFAQGEPASLDFTDTPEPTDELRTAVLIKGEGAELAAEDTVTVDYLGQVYGADQPFDASYEGEPVPNPVAGFVPGFTEAITGQTIGSRIVVAIPPDLGYGEGGNPQAGIGPTDTIYFVVDILGVGEAAPATQ